MQDEEGTASLAEEEKARRRFQQDLAERSGELRPDTGARTDQLDAFEPGDGYGRLWGTCINRGAAVGGFLALALTAVALVEWLAGNVLVHSGALAGARPTPLLTIVLVLLLSGATLLLVRTPVSRERRGLADLLAGLASALALASLVALFAFGGPVAWQETGFFRDPPAANLVLALLVGAGLLIVDRMQLESRYANPIALAIGITLGIGFLSRGYGNTAFSETVALGLSLIGLTGGAALVIAYLSLRPQRGLAGFMTAAGAGPAMARLLAPVVITIPLVLTIGRELSGFAMTTSSEMIWLADEIIVVIILLLVVTYASRRLQGYFEDWREATEELSEQAGVLAAMAEGVAVLRLGDERIVLTNPQFDLMHGYDPGELIGRSIHEIRPHDSTPEEVRDWNRISREMLEEGGSQFETRALCRDGSIIRCRSNSILADDPRHGPVMIIVRSDISREYEAKLARQQAEERFRQVFEQSPVGLALVHPDGSFDRVNRNFERITGYPADELYEMTFGEITHPDDLEEDLELSGAMFRGETAGYSMEKRYIRKDGATVRVDLGAVMLRDAAGESKVALAMVQDVTERYELGQKLRYLADHDPLTGLFNRRRFEQELLETVTGSDRNRAGALAVMLVDIDNFKFINDRHGHSVGDRLIVRTGELLRKRLRSGDVLARQGGDEFVLLLRDVDPKRVAGIAADLVAGIAAGASIEGTGFLARATASIGVAVRANPRGADPGRLLREADIAMYEAKDAGRDGFRVFERGSHSEIARGIEWHGRITEALERDQFTLYAQPLISLKGEPMPQFELFLRLPEEGGRVIAPSTFLPVAERHNLMGEIDRWVVNRALRLLERCDPARKLRLFVNISGQSVGDMELAAEIERELASLEHDPGSLVFEITETSAIANIERARMFVAELARIGCQTALDDFGAGFASFYYLKHITTDFVKIDGEFVRNLTTDPTSQLLVRALTDLSRGLGRRIVAEHVEDDRTLEWLSSYGVDLAQGYLFGRPQPATVEFLESFPEQLPLDA